MNSDALNAGVLPGGLNNRADIRTLICYILTEIDQPVPLEKVKDMLSIGGFINYFEITIAISDLLSKGLINIVSFDENEKYYMASNAGNEISNSLSRALPLTVKEKALQITKKIIERNTSEKENFVEINKLEIGYQVICKVLENKKELLSISLTVPDEKSATKVKENFLSNTYEVFLKITETLLNEKI